MSTTRNLIQLLFIFSIFHLSFGSRQLSELVQDSSNQLNYHNGAPLSGDISVNFIWYGNFKPSQKTIISDFITSLSAKSSKTQIKSIKSGSLSLQLGKQISDPHYSLGKSLTNKHLIQLASKGEPRNAINVVLTASDVAVDGFCSIRCGTHGSSSSSSSSQNTLGKGKNYKFAYIWVGNSETQCPGQCARPKASPLVARNNDVGVDGMVINLASLLAATATNPFGNGYYQRDASASLVGVTVSLCVGGVC